jgi:hypothetical protein
VLPRKTREAAAAGNFADLYDAYKATASLAARSQMHAGRRADAAVAMAAQPDLPTPPIVWRHLMEFIIKCYPGFEPELARYVPLMERIAYKKDGAFTRNQITDPWISILHESDSPLTGTSPNFDHDIFLMDRQPVLKGARYKYLLVRFSPSKEIERVIVTNTVDVP